MKDCFLFQRNPAKRQCTVTMKSGPRRSLGKLKKVINKNKYRRDLKQAALKRASAVLRSQKPVKDGKKAKPAKKTE
jgi:large subunit ribosomal protein L28e